MKLSKQNYLTGTLFRRYVLQCMAWAAVLIVIGASIDFTVKISPAYYGGDLYCSYRTLYTGCLCFAVWAAIVLILTYRLLRRASGYIDEVQMAASQLVDDSDDIIVLSPELNEIADSLNHLKRESLHNAQAARSAEQRKNDLIMYLAHDLKTPLSSVIGYLTLLRDEPDVDEATRTRYLTTTLRKAERLDTLINEFFEITRFNLSKVPLQYHAIDLTRLLEQLVFEAQPLLDSKNLHCQLNTPESLPLRCDPDKMQRVFDNLLRNAILYSYADSTIQITVTRKQEHAIICVLNHGDTIPAENLARLFEQFFRLDSARSSSGGAGLGLAIAKEITLQHGGDISAASDNDTIRFTVTLPLNQPSLS